MLCVNEVITTQKINISKYTTNLVTKMKFNLGELGFHLRKVHPRNKKMYTTSEVRSSRVQVGCKMAVGIIGTKQEPQIHPTTRDPNPIKHALPMLFDLSFRKYMQANRDSATWNAGPPSAEFITLQNAINVNRNNLLRIMIVSGSSTKVSKF